MRMQDTTSTSHKLLRPITGTRAAHHDMNSCLSLLHSRKEVFGMMYGHSFQQSPWCSVRTSRIEGVATKTCNEVFGHLIAHGMTPDELYDAVCKQVSSEASWLGCTLLPPCRTYNQLQVPTDCCARHNVSMSFTCCNLFLLECTVHSQWSLACLPKSMHAPPAELFLSGCSTRK